MAKYWEIEVGAYLESTFFYTIERGVVDYAS